MFDPGEKRMKDPNWIENVYNSLDINHKKPFHERYCNHNHLSTTESHATLTVNKTTLLRQGFHAL